jgi:hypothetical protein
MYDITGLGENFMDGEYYPEDRDPDDDGYWSTTINNKNRMTFILFCKYLTIF